MRGNKEPIDVVGGLRALDRSIEEPEVVEHELLRELVTNNAETEYGRSHGFAAISDLDSFRRQVPLVTYDELKPYIERMMRGEQDVLFAGDTMFFAQTSGTTGTSKYYPYPARTELPKGRIRIGAMLGLIEQDHPGCLSSYVSISGKYCEDVAPCGVPIGSASGFARMVFDLGAILPDGVQDATDYEARYYAILMIALAAPVRMIMTFNPSTILTLFDKAAQYAEPLIADLTAGTMTHGPKCPAELRHAIEPALRPAPAAARRLSVALSEGRVRPHELWPELKLLVTWKAAMAIHYLRDLHERCPTFTIRSMLNAATEGVFTVPLRDDWAGGVPAVFESVLEWFPENAKPRSEDAVPMRELQEGTGYRLALTNHRGLYRYLMEDVFVVEGRHRGLPIVAFSHRVGATSSLTGEKLTEPQVIEAMTNALAEQAVRFVDYQVLPEWGSPPRYVLMVELAAEANDDQLRTVLHRFEAALASLNVEYISKRSSGRLAEPELVELRMGTFQQKRRTRSDDRGRSDATMKIARLDRTLLERASNDIVRTISWRPRG